MGAHRFEEPDVLQRAYKVSLEMHRFTQTMPSAEQYDLGSQIRRASKSICANVAAGFGKQSRCKAECKRYIQMRIGSADEMRVWLRYCLDLGYTDESDVAALVRRVRADREDAQRAAQHGR
jgi:four helix bundle protein